MGTFGDVWASGSIGEDIRGSQSSFWQTLAPKSMILASCLGDSENNGDHVPCAQTSFRHAVVPKSMLLKRKGWLQYSPSSTIIVFHWGKSSGAAKSTALNRRGWFQEGPKLILANICSEYRRKKRGAAVPTPG